MAIQRKACIWVIVTASIAEGIVAQDAGDVRKLAQLDLMQLSEAPIVSAARHQQNRTDSPRAVSVITQDEIRRRGFRNVPEALFGLTGVFLQQTNYGGGSPIIRGMVGNHILILLNGIRLNNGTYRFGPNQYLNQIDINMVDRIEVLRGASSVLYGSDAFGGVVNVITKTAPDPLLGETLGGQVRVRYGSGDLSGAGRVELSGAKGKVGFFGGVTREGFGDLMGGGVGRQLFTGYSQWAGDLQVRYALAPDKTFVLGMMRLRQSDVMRTDVLTKGTDLEYRWAPEGRDMVYAKYSQTRVSRAVEAIEITASYQRPMEYLERITAAKPRVERSYDDEVLQGGLTVMATSRPRGGHLLTYGLETSSDWVTSRRSDLNLDTGARQMVTGNYPDGSRYGSVSAFVQDEVDLAKRLHAVVGLRYDWFHMRYDLNDSFWGKARIHTDPSAWSGSGYALYDLTSYLSAVVGVSQGFRAPNLDDAAVLGGVSARYEIPHAALNPEYSTNYEYALRLKTPKASAALTYYHASYRDLINSDPALLNGLPFVDTNGDGIQDNNEPSVYQRQNTHRAYVRGLEAEATVKLSEDWTWFQTASWTYGVDTTAATPLSKIPPLNTKGRVLWQPNRTFWVEAAAQAAVAQHRLSPADISDIRIGPGGTPGFAVFHLRAGLNRTPLAGLSVWWENIGNLRYRLHSSGFYRSGRAIVVSYQRAF